MVASNKYARSVIKLVLCCDTGHGNFKVLKQKDAYARCGRVCRMHEQALSETARQTT